MKIDFKDGKVDLNILSFIDGNQYVSQDILLIEYKHVLIDLGQYYYSEDNKHYHFAIMVIGRTHKDDYDKDLSDEQNEWDWSNPLAKIPCLDVHDMYAQLQRAINVYGGDFFVI